MYQIFSDKPKRLVTKYGMKISAIYLKTIRKKLSRVTLTDMMNDPQYRDKLTGTSL